MTAGDKRAAGTLCQRHRWLLFLVFLVLAAASLSVYRFTSLHDMLTPETLQAWADQSGWYGVGALFLFGLLSPLLFIPRWIPVMACGLLYGVARGSLLAHSATLGGAWLQYHLAGGLLAPLTDRLRERSWMQKAERHREHTFWVVLGLRTFPLSSFIAVNLAAGSLRLRLSHFMAATLLGSIPSTLIFATWGRLTVAPSTGLLLFTLGVLVVMLAAGFLIRRVSPGGSSTEDEA